MTVETLATQPAGGSPAARRFNDTLERFAEMFEEVRSGTTPIPGMRWRAGEIGAHLTASLRDAVTLLSGEGPSAYAGRFDAGVDQRLVDAIPEREPRELARLLREAATAYLAVIGDREGSEAPGLPGGLSIEGLTAIVTLDLNLHGHQIGTATRAGWRINAQEVRDSVEIVLPFLVDREYAQGFSGTYEVRFKGATPLRYGVRRGEYLTHERVSEVDCRIRAECAPFLLNGIGLFPLWKAALTGAMISYGRRPWLAFRLTKLLPAVPHGGVA